MQRVHDRDVFGFDLETEPILAKLKLQYNEEEDTLAQVEHWLHCLLFYQCDPLGFRSLATRRVPDLRHGDAVCDHGDRACLFQTVGDQFGAVDQKQVHPHAQS